MIMKSTVTALAFGAMLAGSGPASAGMLGAPAPKVSPMQDLVIQVQRRCHRDPDYHSHRGDGYRGSVLHRHTRRDCDVRIVRRDGGRDCHADEEFHDHRGIRGRGAWHYHTRRGCDVRIARDRRVYDEPGVSACGEVGNTGLALCLDF